MNPDITIQNVTGTELLPYIPNLAELRIRVFHDFPYLYAGDPKLEEEYLSYYTKSEEALVVLVLHNQKIVGASTAMPLLLQDEDVKKPFIRNNYNLDEIFYFGESVLLKPYRGLGVGKRFFKERESHAKKLGYLYSAFCGVIRSPDHPRKPANYRPLNSFWESMEYERKDGMTTFFTWPDLDESEASQKEMQFWMKKL